MREKEEQRNAAAAGMLMFYGAACAGCGRWFVFAAAALLAWGLLKGNRAAWMICFGFGALKGTVCAAALAYYAVRVAGHLAPPRTAIDTVWIAYFTGIAVYCLTLASFLAPRRALARA